MGAINRVVYKVTFSGYNEPQYFIQDAEYKKGVIVSGYGSGKIISKSGVVETKGFDGLGWIYLDSELGIIEKNCSGCASIEAMSFKSFENMVGRGKAFKASKSMNEFNKILNNLG